MKRFSLTLLFLAASLFASSNTEIMTEIGPALGYNASVKQIMHVANDDGLTTTRTAIYDADGTASYLYLATTSISINDGTDNWMLMSGLATTFAVGAASGDDFVIEDTAGVDIVTIQGDVKDILFTLDGTEASDILINDGGGVIATIASDENSVTWVLDASSDADYSVGKSGTEQFLLETDVGQITATTDAGFDIVIGTDAGDDFNVSDGSINRIHVDGDADALLTGNWVFTDGAYDFNIASHDGSNGLKLGGTLVTATAANINGITGLTATSTELNYLDIATLGTGAPSKAVVLDANGSYTWPSSDTLFYAILNDGTTTLGATAAELNTLDGAAATLTYGELNILDGVTATYTELNYLDIATLGTGVASKAVVLDAGDDYTWPTAGFLTYGGTQVTATGAELNYLDLGTLGTGAASKAVVLDAGDDYTWPSAGMLTYGGTQVTASGAELNYLDIAALGTGAASKAVVLDANGSYTWSSGDTLFYANLDDGTTTLTSSALELNTLDGVAATLTYNELDILDGVTATYAELNYLDIATLGTGVASKAVVLDAGDDYTWPATGILTYGVLNDGTTTLAATAAEINAVADVLQETVTTTNIIAASENGTRYILNSATGFATDLPAPAAGLHFWFVIGPVEPTTSHTIVTATSANIIEGQVTTSDDAAGDVGCAADSDTITFAANVAIHGDYVYVWSDGTYWYLSGSCDIFNGITATQAS